jgi:hypothetical protein
VCEATLRTLKADGYSRRGVEHSKGGVVNRTKKGGFRRFAVLIAVAAAGVLVVGAQAASAGTLEICKSGANGFSNKTFHFAVTPNIGAATSVDIKPTSNAFTCKSPSLPSATSATIVESDVDASSETQSITVRPGSREVAGTKDLVARKVTVTLGTTTSNETQVFFVNQPPGGTSGTLKVCKLTQTPAYLGRSFSFSVGPTLASQGPLVSTTANDAFDDPANWSCRVLGTFQVGTNLFVKEQIPAGTEVDFIDTDPGANLLDFNTDEGWAQVHIGTGTTIVLFDDEPIPPSGTGYIEVCKNPPNPPSNSNQDPAVTGLWHFTITDSAGTVYERDVVTNQCTEAIQIAAGIATVQETARTGFQLTDIFTVPADALVGSNLINRTADVEVPTSSNPLDEVEVAFINKPITSQLKVCKALGPNSSVLVGQTFNFHVTNITDPNNEVFLGDVSVTAGAGTQCTPFRTLPIGTVVRVDEFFGPDNPMTPFDESGQFITTTSPGTTTIGAGTANTVTITNTAFGLIQICKDPVAGITTQPTFQFRIDGGGIIPVQGGACASARHVSVGNHTVLEVAAADYEVTAITVDPAGRLVGTPDLANRTVTVSVPYGTEGETVVTYTNRIKQGRYKVCKAIPATSFDSLNGKPFNFILYIQTGGTHAAPTFTPTPLTLNASTDRLNLTVCSGFTAFYNILQPNGERTIAAVQEQLGPGFAVDSITVNPSNGLCVFGTGLPTGAPNSPACVPGGIDKTGATTPGFAEIDWFLSGGNLGNAQVTFTNRSV